MPLLQPNIVRTGNGDDMYVPMGAGNVIPEAVTFAGEVFMNGGVTLNNIGLTTVGEDVTVTEGASLTAIDGNCRVITSAITQEVAYIDMTGNTDDGPVVRLAVGGGSAVAPFETYKFGIYATQGGASPFVEALTVDDSAVVKIAGKPVCSPSRVAYTGVSGTTITLAQGVQTISDAFAVKANHTYRVTVQARIISGDTNPGAFVELDVVSPGATVVVGLGHQIGGPNNENGDKAYIGMFVAPSDETGYVVKSQNATIASATLDLVNTSVNPGVLIEDLGVF